MTLDSGALLGPYQILAPLGAGGMGEVYRAKDGRLGREVAIKVLPAGFAIDTERLKRFELEAKATSALNHPNILSIFDIGTHEGAPYLVAELLEGQTLREKLNGGPLPPRKVVEWAVQMAHGLAAAHEKNIVHRDLKPENLFITKDGRLKILDFGLAKLTEAARLPEEENNTPTRTVGTAAGSVMGTVGYMSPEQVRGEPVDARSDLFAFGVILYEMISGVRAFKKNSAVETMNAILTEEPAEFASLQPPPPPGLERIIHHCLEKMPSSRYQSACDLGFQLEALSGMSSGAVVAVPSTPHLERQIYRATILPPEKSKFEIGKHGTLLAVSPDGRKLVFAAQAADNKKLLWVRALDRLTATPLAGTDGAIAPFWSPDSRTIGFFSGDMLKKIDAGGGPIIMLCDAPSGVSGTWGASQLILFASRRDGKIYQVSSSGGAATCVPRPEGSDQDALHGIPQFLPDGRHYFYRRRHDSSKRISFAIYVASLDGKTNQFVMEADANYAHGSGFLLYMREQQLVAQSFDANSLTLTGEAMPVAESVQYALSNMNGVFTVSHNGVLVYQSAVANDYNNIKLTWLDRSGKRISLLGKPAAYRQFRISPDGRQVVVVIGEPGKRTANLWIYDVARGLKTRLTFEPGFKQNPIWSPDGRQIAYNSYGTDHHELRVIAADGSGVASLLLESKFRLLPSDWSPDGGTIAYFESDHADKNKWSLKGLPLQENAQPKLILPAGAAMRTARFSPDGKWLAYYSELSGQDDVFVTPFPGPGGKTLVASEDSEWPVWRKDGKSLLFWTRDALLESTVESVDGTMEVGVPQSVFSMPSVGDDKDIDISGDGLRFLMTSATDDGDLSPPPLTLVINWDAELKK